MCRLGTDGIDSSALYRANKASEASHRCIVILGSSAASIMLQIASPLQIPVAKQVCVSAADSGCGVETRKEREDAGRRQGIASLQDLPSSKCGMHQEHLS